MCTDRGGTWGSGQPDWGTQCTNQAERILWTMVYPKSTRLFVVSKGQLYVETHICMHVGVSKCVYMHRYVYVCIHMCIHVCMCMCVCVYIYIYTHIWGCTRVWDDIDRAQTKCTTRPTIRDRRCAHFRPQTPLLNKKTREIGSWSQYRPTKTDENMSVVQRRIERTFRGAKRKAVKNTAVQRSEASLDFSPSQATWYHGPHHHSWAYHVSIRRSLSSV